MVWRISTTRGPRRVSVTLDDGVGRELVLLLAVERDHAAAGPQLDRLVRARGGATRGPRRRGRCRARSARGRARRPAPSRSQSPVGSSRPVGARWAPTAESPIAPGSARVRKSSASWSGSQIARAATKRSREIARSTSARSSTERPRSSTAHVEPLGARRAEVEVDASRSRPGRPRSRRPSRRSSSAGRCSCRSRGRPAASGRIGTRPAARSRRRRARSGSRRSRPTICSTATRVSRGRPSKRISSGRASISSRSPSSARPTMSKCSGM